MSLTPTKEGQTGTIDKTTGHSPVTASIVTNQINARPTILQVMIEPCEENDKSAKDAMTLEHLPLKLRKYNQKSGEKLVKPADRTTRLSAKSGAKTRSQSKACATADEPVTSGAASSKKVPVISDAVSVAHQPGPGLVPTFRTLLHGASKSDDAHPPIFEKGKNANKSKRAPAQKKKEKQTKSGNKKEAAAEAPTTATANVQADLRAPPTIKSRSKKTSNAALPKDAAANGSQLQQGAKRTNQLAAPTEDAETEPTVEVKGAMTRSRSKRPREADAEGDGENNLHQMMDDPESRLRKIARRK